MELYWIWLSQLKGLSKGALHLFWEQKINPKTLYQLSETELLGKGFSRKDTDVLLQRDLIEGKKIVEVCKGNGIGILTPEDQDYPAPLLALDRIPLVIYYSGNLPDFEHVLTIAVVGHRKPLDQSRVLTSEISADLAKNGVVLVSGGAEGIDSAAMSGALKAGGYVVGVLGNGIDVVYPSCNRQLFRDIVKTGCLISEYPPGTLPTKWNFPERNRIISALSHGVLVAEASKKSGSMITANYALEQGKDLFAIPGMAASERFSGSNDLIRQGAYLTESAEDILSNYRSIFEIRERYDSDSERGSQDLSLTISEDMDEVEKVILSCFKDEALSVDELVFQSRFTASQVALTLTMLQIKGLIQAVPGGAFIRK